MKKQFTIFVFIFSAYLIKSQTLAETWNFQGHSVGAGAAGSATISECFMPEVIRVGSQYIMYFNGRKSNRPAIYYATSSNMINWSVQDTILTGSTDTLSRDYEIGGASVIKLNNGQYRLFYRTCPKFSGTVTPQYHVRSAISSNGTTFTREGVKIEIKPFLSNSLFKLVGQSAMYRDVNGTVRAVLTAKDTVLNMVRLYTASSPDEGQTWGNFAVLYNSSHDPVVIKDSTGNYHVYYSYLMSGHRKAVSTNGISWPSTPDSIVLKQGSNVLNENSSPNMIADLGAGVDATGATVLYSNHKPFAPGPWTNIAYYFMQATSLREHNANEDLSVYPNPASEYLFIKSKNKNKKVISVYNALGEIVYENQFEEFLEMKTADWGKGIYYYRVKGKENLISGKIILE